MSPDLNYRKKFLGPPVRALAPSHPLNLSRKIVLESQQETGFTGWKYQLNFDSCQMKGIGHGTWKESRVRSSLASSKEYNAHSYRSRKKEFNDTKATACLRSSLDMFSNHVIRKVMAAIQNKYSKISDWTLSLPSIHYAVPSESNQSGAPLKGWLSPPYGIDFLVRSVSGFGVCEGEGVMDC